MNLRTFPWEKVNLRGISVGKSEPAYISLGKSQPKGISVGESQPAYISLGKGQPKGDFSREKSTCVHFPRIVMALFIVSGQLA